MDDKTTAEHAATTDALDRFLSNLDIADCWIWTGTRDTRGYGMFRTLGIGAQAHRWLWLQLVGPIPAGLELDHLCRVHECVNPDHLEPVTHRENVLRGEGFAAAFAARDRCSQGHEYTPENTITSRGWRECRECKRLDGLEHWRRNADELNRKRRERYAQARTTGDNR